MGQNNQFLKLLSYYVIFCQNLRAVFNTYDLSIKYFKIHRLHLSVYSIITTVIKTTMNKDDQIVVHFMNDERFGKLQLFAKQQLMI